jgi:hypothetical protein
VLKVVRMIGALALTAFVVAYPISYVTTRRHPFQPERAKPSVPTSKRVSVRCYRIGDTRGQKALAQKIKKICARTTMTMP